MRLAGSFLVRAGGVKQSFEWLSNGCLMPASLIRFDVIFLGDLVVKEIPPSLGTRNGLDQVSERASE